MSSSFNGEEWSFSISEEYHEGVLFSSEQISGALLVSTAPCEMVDMIFLVNASLKEPENHGTQLFTDHGKQRKEAEKRVQPIVYSH